MKITLEAGREFVWHFSGDVYRIINASGAVYVGAGRNGAYVTEYEGTGRRVRGGFDVLRFLSDTAQQVEVTAGEGEIYDSRLSLADGTVVRVDQGYLSASKDAIVNCTSTSHFEFLSPSVNVAGVRIYGIYGIASAGTGPWLFYSADVMKSQYLNDGKPIATVLDINSNPVGLFPVVIPPGDGVYATNVASNNQLLQTVMAYEVLQP